MFSVSQLLVIMLGGAVGALLRFLVSTSVYQVMGRSFPYGTLSVNLIGSFLMGFLAVLFMTRLNELSPHWQMAILVGFLGSFTTFSTFSLDTLALLQQGEFIKATANVFLSVLVCLVAVWLGGLLAKQL